MFKAFFILWNPLQGFYAKLCKVIEWVQFKLTSNLKMQEGSIAVEEL